jgi:dihydroorotate dehydrogenase
MRLRHRVREFAKKLGFGVDEAAEKRVLNGEAGVPPGSLKPGKLMAVQVAKNKFTPDNDIKAVTADYIYCVDALAPYADIIVVNVSSPNTPGLRDLQASAPLTSILTGVVNAAKSVDRKTKPAVMVKVSPDEDTDEQIMGICDAVWESGVDGVIVGNTTKRRPESIPSGYSLPPKEMQLLLEQGGFSGPHLFQQTVNLVKKYRGLLNSRPPPKSDASTTPSSGTQSADTPKVIFATGGITSGKQAQEVLDAGAQVAMVRL